MDENIDKDVIATVKYPKNVVKGKLTEKDGEFYIKNGNTVRKIDHENTKAISIVITKTEIRLRRQRKFVNA